jgi:hypothetical protein
MIRYHCFFCAKTVSNEVPNDTVIRAALICPECIGMADHKKFDEVLKDIEARLKDNAVESAWNKVKLAADDKDPEAVLKTLGEFFLIVAKEETHETVKSLLEGLSTDCDRMSYNYYVSTK